MGYMVLSIYILTESAITRTLLKEFPTENPPKQPTVFSYQLSIFFTLDLNCLTIEAEG